MRSISLIFLIAVGCSSSEDATNCGTDCPESDTDTDTDTNADTDTDTLSAEDCSDGIDNDGDGLLDCEDGDCVDDEACLPETACDDGIDNDNDGRTDCTDDDCWGNGCAVTIATLNDATRVFSQKLTRGMSYYGSPACSSSLYFVTYNQGIIGASGSVRHMPASTPVWSTCTWTAGLTSWQGSASGGGGGYPVTRTGFAIEPGCALTTSGFMPQYLGLDNVAYPILNIVTRPTGNGPRWASFNIDSAVIEEGSTAYVNPGSPCTLAVKTHYYYNSYYEVGAGSSYSLAQP